MSSVFFMLLKYKKNTRNTNYTIAKQLVNRIMPYNGLMAILSTVSCQNLTNLGRNRIAIDNEKGEEKRGFYTLEKDATACPNRALTGSEFYLCNFTILPSKDFSMFCFGKVTVLSATVPLGTMNDFSCFERLSKTRKVSLPKVR